MVTCDLCRSFVIYVLICGLYAVGARYPWSPNNVHQAKAIMIFNLAATHAMRGEHEKALQHLGKVLFDILLCLPT